MTRTVFALVFAAAAAMPLISQAPAPLAVMILDGESGGPYHDWPRVTAALKQMLDETGLFATTVVTAPPRGGDFSAFAPDFMAYRAVVLNYDAPDDRWPAALKASFERYVREGGGLVSVHALSSVDFVVTLQRGTEWAATGHVTQRVPATFPTADTVAYRADLAAMDPSYGNGLDSLTAPRR